MEEMAMHVKARKDLGLTVKEYSRLVGASVGITYRRERMVRLSSYALLESNRSHQKISTKQLATTFRKRSLEEESCKNINSHDQKEDKKSSLRRIISLTRKMNGINLELMRECEKISNG